MAYINLTFKRFKNVKNNEILTNSDVRQACGVVGHLHVLDLFSNSNACCKRQLLEDERGGRGEGGGGSAFGFRPFNWIKETAPREEIVGVGYNLIKV